MHFQQRSKRPLLKALRETSKKLLGMVALLIIISSYITRKYSGIYSYKSIYVGLVRSNLRRSIIPSGVRRHSYRVGRPRCKRAISSRRSSIFNIHLSLLPELRGPSPVETAILNNNSRTGFTVFRIDEDIDTGKIIFQKDVPISEDDYASNIYERLSDSFNEQYKEIDFLSTGKEQSQNSTKSSKFSKSDFDISEDTLIKAKRKIRAFNILGPSFTYHKNKILKIHSYTEENNSEGIMYKEGVLYPEYVTPEGKNKMLFPDYLRGLK